MYKLFLFFLYLLNLIFLQCAAECGKEHFNTCQAYNVKLLVNSLGHLQNYRKLNRQDLISIANLKFKSFNDIDILYQLTEKLQKSKCLADILYTLRHLKDQQAIHMLDSYGKFGSGILQGNVKWVGDYSECVQVHSSNPNSAVGNFVGKYCSVTWFFSFRNMSAPIPLIHGICIPKSCSTTEVKDLWKSSLVPKPDDLLLNDVRSLINVTVVCMPTERHLNIGAKAFIALLSVFCALAVLGSTLTAVQYFKSILKEPKGASLVINVSERYHPMGDVTPTENIESDDELLTDNLSVTTTKGFLDRFKDFLGCFCVFTNGAKLLNTDSSDGQLLCIHGIRFLSMSWVILGHTYGFCFIVARNPAEAIKLIDNFPFQVVLQGFYAVDSFFVLSGFLLAYLLMKEFERTKGAVSWLYFYIHRYIRLTPLYMFVLGFSATVFFYIGSGPFWPVVDFDPVCRDNWWYNLLYINNFIGFSEQCMAWSWYLANDMQFFVISPLFLISLWQWPKVGYVLIAAFLCSCWLSNFIITYHYKLVTGVSDIINNPNDIAEALPKFFVYFDKLYIKPYARISPYLIGMLVGYLLFKSNSKKRPKHSWVFLCMGWIVATTITLACVYGLYHNHPTLIASSFYNALNRTTFSLGLSWVIYVCLLGQGGFVNSILSYKFFVPLGRLTYCAYLIHPMVLSAYYSSLKTAFEISHPTMVITYLGAMVVTYGLSLPISLVLEYPIASLEKMVLKAFSKKESI